MGQRGTVFVTDVSLTTAGDAAPETFVVRIAQHPSESREGLVMRLLAYCLEFRDGIQLRGEVCRPEEPAISVVDYSGRRRLWVHVGLPDRAPLRLALRAADRVVVYATVPLPILRRHAHGLPAPAVTRLKLCALDPRLVTRVAHLLTRRSALDVTSDGSTVYVRVNGTSVSGWLEVASAARAADGDAAG